MTDLILRNANILTQNTGHPKASAIWIQGETVHAVGNDDTVTNLASGAKIVDLGGSTVLPGLADSHGHLRNLGRLNEMIHLFGAESFEEVVDRVRRKSQETPPGNWIVGRGWNQEMWPDKSMPRHELLSEAVPSHPVWLVRVDAHAGLANTAAMRTAGIGRSTSAPSGGVVVRDSSTPVGLFLDNAMSLIESHIPEPDVDSLKQWYLAAQEQCLSAGLTEVHDAGVSERHLAALKALVAEGKLKIRVYAMLDRAYFDGSDISPFTHGRLSCRSVKVVADGALGSRGAAMSSPYSDSLHEKGFLLLSVEQLRATMDRALDSGFQVNTHAIGDQANHVALDAIEAVLKNRPGVDHRSRIEHAQIVRLEDIPRFSELGVIASVQPTHCTSDMNMTELRVGPDRVRGAHPWRKFLASGAAITGGSDFPVENHNPFLGIYAAVTRQDLAGNPAGGWYSEEALTIGEALALFTTGPAYASFQEKTRGTLEPGKLADMTVIDRDITILPPSSIPDTKVLATIIGGEVVFSRLTGLAVNG